MLIRPAIVSCSMALSAGAALAQQAQPSMAERNLGSVVQQIGPAISLYAEELQRKLAEKDARIAELLRLCGEPCKPVAEAK